MGHENPTQGGSHDHAGGQTIEERPEPPRQGRPEGRSQWRIHENAGALEVTRRVETRREEEVSLEQSFPFLKELKESVARL